MHVEIRRSAAIPITAGPNLNRAPQYPAPKYPQTSLRVADEPSALCVPLCWQEHRPLTRDLEACGPRRPVRKQGPTFWWLELTGPPSLSFLRDYGRLPSEDWRASTVSLLPN